MGVELRTSVNSYFVQSAASRHSMLACYHEYPAPEMPKRAALSCMGERRS